MVFVARGLWTSRPVGLPEDVFWGDPNNATQGDLNNATQKKTKPVAKQLKPMMKWILKQYLVKNIYIPKL